MLTYDRGGVSRDDAQNVIHIRAGSPPDAEAAADLAEAWWTGEGLTAAGVRSLVTNQWFLRSITVYNVPEDPPAAVMEQREFANESPYQGQNANPPLPPQCCMVASLRTPLPGRSGRGRIYVGGIGNDALESDGRLDASSRETLAEVTAEIAGGPLEENVFLVVYSPLLGSAGSLNNVIVDNAVDTQRSRGQEPTAASSQPVPAGA